MTYEEILSSFKPNLTLWEDEVYYTYIARAYDGVPDLLDMRINNNISLPSTISAVAKLPRPGYKYTRGIFDMLYPNKFKTYAPRTKLQLDTISFYKVV